MCSLFFIWGGKLFPILQLDIYFKTHPTSPPRCLPDLMHCEHLKRLSLDGNRLRELPELPVSLEKISLQDNCLTLPGSVFWEMLVASGLGLVVFLYIYTNIFVGKEVNSENGKIERVEIWKIPWSFVGCIWWGKDYIGGIFSRLLCSIAGNKVLPWVWAGQEPPCLGYYYPIPMIFLAVPPVTLAHVFSKWRYIFCVCVFFCVFWSSCLYLGLRQILSICPKTMTCGATDSCLSFPQSLCKVYSLKPKKCEFEIIHEATNR